MQKEAGGSRFVGFGALPFIEPRMYFSKKRNSKPSENTHPQGNPLKPDQNVESKRKEKRCKTTYKVKNNTHTHTTGIAFLS